MSYITHIGTANPAHKFRQQELAEFMVKVHRLQDDEANRLRALYRATGIETRHSVLPDYGTNQVNKLFPSDANLEPFPSTEQRMNLYKRHALDLSLAAISDSSINDLAGITHLVTVSCTGMYAPGLDIDLVRELKLNTTVHRTCVNFMGCYAAFSALKLADAFCKDDARAKVLVVCTELCSLHFQRENTEDNYLANALFGDGSAAFLVENRPNSKRSFLVKSFQCDLLLNGGEHMAWGVGDFGFEMKLSNYVPDVLKTGLAGLKDRILREQSIDYFVIHPGGKRILEAIEGELGVTRGQNGHAFSVLSRYGNMSSPTILFVLKEFRDFLTPADSHKNLLAMAFGPGITLESCILETVFA